MRKGELWRRCVMKCFIPGVFHSGIFLGVRLQDIWSRTVDIIRRTCPGPGKGGHGGRGRGTQLKDAHDQAHGVGVGPAGGTLSFLSDSSFFLSLLFCVFVYAISRWQGDVGWREGVLVSPMATAIGLRRTHVSRLRASRFQEKKRDDQVAVAMQVQWPARVLFPSSARIDDPCLACWCVAAPGACASLRHDLDVHHVHPWNLGPFVSSRTLLHMILRLVAT